MWFGTFIFDIALASKTVLVRVSLMPLGLPFVLWDFPFHFLFSLFCLLACYANGETLQGLYLWNDGFVRGRPCCLSGWVESTSVLRIGPSKVLSAVLEINDIFNSLIHNTHWSWHMDFRTTQSAYSRKGLPCHLTSFSTINRGLEQTANSTFVIRMSALFCHG